MVQNFIIMVNGQPFLGESGETYPMGDSFSGQSFHTKNNSSSVLTFGYPGDDGGYVITGRTNLLSYLARIVRYFDYTQTPIRSISICCATCGGAGGVEVGDNNGGCYTESCPDCSTRNDKTEEVEQ